MHLSVIKTVFVALILGVSGSVFGQTPDTAVKPSYFSGDVASISSGSIVITTKAGPKEVLLSEKTAFKRASAEDLNTSTATPGALADIGVGDKVSVSALLSADGKSMNARTVYFVAKGDIAQRQAKESEQWKTRGISGKVASVNAASNQIIVEIPGLMSKAITVTLNENARIRRFSGDSVVFSEARTGTLAEIKVGDQINALGTKGDDGTTLLAEAIVTGTFIQFPGTVKSVDAAKNEIVIKDNKGKDLTVGLNRAVMMKRFPIEVAERMAMGRGNGGFRPPNAGEGQQNAQPAPGQQGQGRGTRGGGTSEMLERLPNITVAELKPGEQIGLLILVSDPTTLVGDHIKAIKLIAGIEPFIRMQKASPTSNRGQGVQGGFTIPGLDGGGF